MIIRILFAVSVFFNILLCACVANQNNKIRLAESLMREDSVEYYKHLTKKSEDV